MSAVPGFHSRTARLILRIALAAENFHRRRRGTPPLTGALNITINGVGYRTSPGVFHTNGKLGGALVDVRPDTA